MMGKKQYSTRYPETEFAIIGMTPMTTAATTSMTTMPYGRLQHWALSVVTIIMMIPVWYFYASKQNIGNIFLRDMYKIFTRLCWGRYNFGPPAWHGLPRHHSRLPLTLPQWHQQDLGVQESQPGQEHLCRASGFWCELTCIPIECKKKNTGNLTSLNSRFALLRASGNPL